MVKQCILQVQGMADLQHESVQYHSIVKKKGNLEGQGDCLVSKCFLSLNSTL